jgi:predicted transcriptional regulator
MCQTLVAILDNKHLWSGKYNYETFDVLVANKVLVRVFDEDLRDAIKNIISSNTKDTEKIQKIFDVLRKALEV